MSAFSLAGIVVVSLATGAGLRMLAFRMWGR